MLLDFVPLKAVPFWWSVFHDSVLPLYGYGEEDFSDFSAEEPRFEDGGTTREEEEGGAGMREEGWEGMCLSLSGEGVGDLLLWTEDGGRFSLSFVELSARREKEQSVKSNNI